MLPRRAKIAISCLTAMAYAQVHTHTHNTSYTNAFFYTDAFESAFENQYVQWVLICPCVSILRLPWASVPCFFTCPLPWQRPTSQALSPCSHWPSGSSQSSGRWPSRCPLCHDSIRPPETNQSKGEKNKKNIHKMLQEEREERIIL